MKVLQFVADGSPGGGTTHVCQLLRGLPDTVEVGLLTETDSFLARRAAETGITVFGGNFFRGRLSRVDPRCVGQVRDALRRFRPDVIHCHGGRAAFFRSFVADDCSTVCTAHGLHYSRKPSRAARVLGKFGERWACRRADHVIYVCRHDANLSRADRLVRPRIPVTVIYPSIAPHGRRRVARGSARPTIGFIGRLVPQKNPLAFLEILRRVTDVHAVIGGGGPLEAELRTHCEQLDLMHRTELLGELSPAGVQELLCRIDILVMTSLWEGLPALVLEAMYLGIPVVSTAVGGIAEIVEHGRTGLLSTRGDYDDMANLVRRLVDAPDDAHRIGEAAREQLRAQYLEPTMVAAVNQVYEQVLTERNASSHAVANEARV